MNWLDRHRIEIWLSLACALLIVTVDQFKRGLMIIVGFPVVVMMIVSHNTHAFTWLGIFAAVMTFAVEVMFLMLLLAVLMKSLRKAEILLKGSRLP